MPRWCLLMRVQEPNCDTDQRQFKGIFVRYLMYLLQSPGTDAAHVQTYTSWITLNFNSAYTRNRNGTDFGLLWEGPSCCMHSLVLATGAAPMRGVDALPADGVQARMCGIRRRAMWTRRPCSISSMPWPCWPHRPRPTCADTSAKMTVCTFARVGRVVVRAVWRRPWCMRASTLLLC